MGERGVNGVLRVFALFLEFFQRAAPAGPDSAPPPPAFPSSMREIRAKILLGQPARHPCPGPRKLGKELPGARNRSFVGNPIMRKSIYAVVAAMSLFTFLMPFAKGLEVGDAAPTVTAADQDGKPLVFNDVYQKGITLVYFYPKADTSGCTAEACSLRDNYDDLRAKGLSVIGVSEDKADAQKKFQDKYKLPFPLIADHDGAVAKAFGVPTMLGFAKRQSFLVKDGKIVWRDLNASTKNQAADVRKAMEGLAK